MKMLKMMCIFFGLFSLQGCLTYTASVCQNHLNDLAGMEKAVFINGNLGSGTRIPLIKKSLGQYSAEIPGEKGQKQSVQISTCSLRGEQFAEISSPKLGEAPTFILSKISWLAGEHEGRKYRSPLFDFISFDRAKLEAAGVPLIQSQDNSQAFTIDNSALAQPESILEATVLSNAQSAQQPSNLYIFE